ncbi:OmpA family protein [Mycobacterium sp. pUA109]|uniref:channel-forming protein ArfA/OmpATb n=1 Tax=Mycobacterium sp. pUA109 TaxID=3238982 RepID=UPI00351B123C
MPESEAGSDEAPAATEWRKAAAWYRRRPGLAWLIGLVLIPALLGVIGYGVNDRSRSQEATPSGALPTLTETSAVGAPSAVGVPPAVPPQLALAPLSIVRSGDQITLDGDMPSPEAKRVLLDTVIAAVGQDVNINDNLGVNPDVKALDFSAAGPFFNAAAGIADFNLGVNGDTITLRGTAAVEADQDAVEDAAVKAWPNVNIADYIKIAGPVTPNETPAPAPAPAPNAPPPPAPNAPAPPAPAPAACANLQADISGLLKTPITFTTDGSTLTPAAEQTLTQVAGKLTACPTTQVAVNGYTDNTGTDAINTALSGKRAQAVAEFLVAHGVPGDHITSKGLGAADPVASNDTPAGQAQNRRVEIVVS